MTIAYEQQSAYTWFDTQSMEQQAGAGTWLEGKRFTSRTTVEELVSWAKGLGIAP